MNAVIFVIIFALVVTATYSQVKNLDNIQWTKVQDTSTHHIVAGFYFCMPAPYEHKNEGFRFTDESYFIAEKEFLSLKYIDTVYRAYDANLKSKILNIRFNEDGVEQLKTFTMKWQGFSIGLLLKNKLLIVALLPSPIDGGLVSITGDFSSEHINTLKDAIKKSKP
jgi:hypothetical protein